MGDDNRDNRIKKFLHKSKKDGYIVNQWGVSIFMTFMETEKDAKEFMDYMKDCVEDYFDE